MDIYSHTKLVLDAFALLRVVRYPRLVFHASSRSIGGGKEAGKAPPSRNKENRGAEAKERYFLRDFPLILKGNFSASKEREKKRQTLRHYRTQHHHRTHNIIYKNGIRDEVTNQRRFQKSRTGEENGHSGEEGTFLNVISFARRRLSSKSERIIIVSF